jgi:hypothetical protein
MKARTTSTQPRGSEGDQAGRTADFIDSIGQLRTSQSRLSLSAQPYASTTRRELAHITSLAYLPLFCC